MKKENSVAAGHGAPTGRITRAQAAAFHAYGGMIPSLSSVAKPKKKQTQQGKSKRAARDENSQAASLTAGFQHKKRQVLKDVSNICSDTSYRHCNPAAKVQSKAYQQVKPGCSKANQCSDRKNFKLVPAASIDPAIIHDAAQNKVDEEMPEIGMMESKEATFSVKMDERLLALQNMQCVRDMESTCDTAFVKEHSFRAAGVINHLKTGGFTGKNVVDIDADHGNPQMCSIYAEDIYTNLRAAELIRRPSSNFMETSQRDITHGMRGILIDWLVEVSEEYRLVPDTLYLTVNIIDRFLSHNYIERQRLQLLGVTCMLIASKYEEICAPRVEEFCFITDNTYTKAEVLKMESQVLNYLGFQLSVPTIKPFLRRFLRAAQACYKVPSLALGYLANYLAELTLIDYNFLEFLPSVIAASAVFLARWTLDQSDQPWNLTLEHYTSYKASDLKATVLALQELQMNSKNCPLNAIREKYRQQKNVWLL
uniref:Cyclin-A2-1 isoform X2 n=1 Tax=Elaeis guineensis var. tenera TaxID=51953 RepID=A0A8N4EUY8_ELAGV|nr:cyclin-A2-1 isoform X2 [Elaeis guineensis]